MNYTPQEVADLLKDKPQQPHYIAAVVQKAVDQALAQQDKEIEALQSVSKEMARVGMQQRNDLEHARKEIEELRKLIADIKAWDVDQFITLPLALRERMQAVLDNAEQTGQ